MRELALSMEFDLSKYEQSSEEQAEFSKNLDKPESNMPKSDSYDGVLNGIEDLIHQ